MKLDYEYIKQLLLTMEEYPEHEIESHDFWKLIGLSSNDGKFDTATLDKFIGHMKILSDDFLIESSADNFGFVFNRGNLFTATAYYRITSKGYEFLDILKNDTVFNKIKTFALSNAFEIGKNIFVDITSKIITGGM